jgi:hypothetical protein
VGGIKDRAQVQRWPVTVAVTGLRGGPAANDSNTDIVLITATWLNVFGAALRIRRPRRMTAVWAAPRHGTGGTRVIHPCRGRRRGTRGGQPDECEGCPRRGTPFGGGYVVLSAA